MPREQEEGSTFVKWSDLSNKRLVKVNFLKLRQGVYQTLKTLKDSNFDLVTPRTPSSIQFEQNDLVNPGNYAHRI